MQPIDFVRSLKSECRDSAVAGCVSTLENPPGRRPRQEFLELSQWFLGLSATDRQFVILAMQEAADSTLFGVLCVLDGVRAIESSPEKSEFTISATRDGLTSVIAPGEEFLHDMYRSEV